MTGWTQAAMFILGAYLCGSIPFGLLIGWCKGVDIRKAGSGNIGATNVGRVLGRPYGVLAFLLDAIKGFAPPALAGHWLLPLGGGAAGAALQPVDYLVWMAVAGSAVLGHIFPLWLGFKGGKGVASGWGAMLGIYPYFTIPGLTILGLWVVVTVVTRYVSLGSIIAALAFPLMFALVAWWKGEAWGDFSRLWPLYVFSVGLAALVVYRHRGNVQRLLHGTESRIGSKPKVITCLAAALIGSWQSQARAETPTSQPAVTQPAEAGWGQPNPGEPAARRVLARLDHDFTITQADFEDAIGQDMDPRYYDTVRDGILRGLLERRLFELYVRDHPDLVSDSQVDAQIKKDMKQAGLTSSEQLEARLRQADYSLKRYRLSVRAVLAQAALADKGERIANDPEAMRRIYNQRPDEFNGTTLRARQLMLLVPLDDTAEERAAKREELRKMRDDIIAGRRTWEDCVRRTDSSQRDGELDPFPRYLMMNPLLTEAAFALPVGQLSEVFQTLLGYHVIEVLERIPGTRPFEDVSRNMRRWLIQEPYTLAVMEAIKRYPVVGVQKPLKPVNLAAGQSELEKMLRSGRFTPRPRRPASQPAHTRPTDR